MLYIRFSILLDVFTYMKREKVYQNFGWEITKSTLVFKKQKTPAIRLESPGTAGVFTKQPARDDGAGLLERWPSTFFQCSIADAAKGAAGVRRDRGGRRFADRL